MKVSEMSQADLKMMIRSENVKANRVLKRDLKDSFMTRGDCLQIHLKEGKPTNGGMTRQKAKFYGAMAGLIGGISTIIALVVSMVTEHYK